MAGYPKGRPALLFSSHCLLGNAQSENIMANKLEIMLCHLCRMMNKLGKFLGFKNPGILGYIPSCGAWWYRADIQLPFTRIRVGFVSGGKRTWRIYYKCRWYWIN